MTIKDIIKLCCWDTARCFFSDIIPERCGVVKTATPKAVIDGNCWIYECAYKLARDIARNKSEALEQFWSRFLKRIGYVEKCGWVPSIIFDGRSLPIKKKTDDKRRLVREAARRKAEKLETQGHGDTAAAASASTAAFKATHSIIHFLVLRIRAAGYDVIVAPHEGHRISDIIIGLVTIIYCYHECGGGVNSGKINDNIKIKCIIIQEMHNARTTH